MTTTIDIQPELRSRNDLVRVVEESARFLEQLAQSDGVGATAGWRVRSHPQGGLAVTVYLDVKDWAFSTSITCPVDQLADPRLRELRLKLFWDLVLQDRLERQVRRTDELIAQAEGE